MRADMIVICTVGGGPYSGKICKVVHAPLCNDGWVEVYVLNKLTLERITPEEAYTMGVSANRVTGTASMFEIYDHGLVMRRHVIAPHKSVDRGM